MAGQKEKPTALAAVPRGYLPVYSARGGERQMLAHGASRGFSHAPHPLAPLPARRGEGCQGSSASRWRGVGPGFPGLAPWANFLRPCGAHRAGLAQGVRPTRRTVSCRFHPRRKGTDLSVPQPYQPLALVPSPQGEGVHVYEFTVNSDDELTVATNFSPSRAPCRCSPFKAPLPVLSGT